MTQTAHPKWRRFGAELRKLRTHAGLAQGQMARMVSLSRSMLSAVERGTRAPKREHAELADRALDTGGALTRLWHQITDRHDAPNWFHNVLLMEQQATQIREYHSSVLPGLLQTADYARAIIRSGRPWDVDVNVERLVKVRTSRLETLLKESKPLLWFVIDEDVLRRPLSKPNVNRGQFQHLLDLAEKEQIRIQLIQRTAHEHPGWSGPLRLMSFNGRAPVAYVEHLLGGELVDDQMVVEQCSIVFGTLQAEALSPSASSDLINEWLGDLR